MTQMPGMKEIDRQPKTERKKRDMFKCVLDNQADIQPAGQSCKQYVHSLYPKISVQG